MENIEQALIASVNLFEATQQVNLPEGLEHNMVNYMYASKLINKYDYNTLGSKFGMDELSAARMIRLIPQEVKEQIKSAIKT